MLYTLYPLKSDIDFCSCHDENYFESYQGSNNPYKVHQNPIGMKLFFLLEDKFEKEIKEKIWDNILIFLQNHQEVQRVFSKNNVVDIKCDDVTYSCHFCLVNRSQVMISEIVIYKS